MQVCSFNSYGSCLVAVCGAPCKAVLLVKYMLANLKASQQNGGCEERKLDNNDKPHQAGLTGGGPAARCSAMGIRNASVLPVPVLAFANTSYPCQGHGSSQVQAGLGWYGISLRSSCRSPSCTVSFQSYTSDLPKSYFSFANIHTST